MSTNGTARSVVAAVITAVLVAAPARAQTPEGTGGVEGTVRTATGAPVPSASVTLEPEPAGDPERRASTDADGRYRFTRVLPGRYRLHLSAQGFQPLTLTLDVTAGPPLTVSARLERLTPPPQRPARDTMVVVTGRVLDAGTGLPIAGAIVSMEGTSLDSQTDTAGRYRLENAPPGPQVLRARIIGYAVARLNVTLPARGTVERDVRLSANPLMLEEVIVTADPVSRARGELATATVIDQHAIRHQTATSLAGVLELSPGVAQQAPGLDGLQQIALRAATTSGSSAAFGQLPGGRRATDLASLGTLIVLDGVPVSNNTNLQSLGPRGELSFTTSAGGGIDLRQVPASTLERVEVIRGVPSARWGDLTQGAIVVDTRAGDVAPELRAQYDARTSEVSLVAGTGLWRNHTGTATFDFAGSSSSPGRADDYAYRVAGQLMHRFDTDGLRLDTRADFYQLDDDRPINPATGQNRGSLTRDRGIRLIERARVRTGATSRLDVTAAYTRVAQHTTAEAELNRTALPFTSQLTEGRLEGFYVIGPYDAHATIAGEPTLAYGRLEWSHERRALRAQHELRAGLEVRREWNQGPGSDFDVQFPLQVSFNGVNGYDRPRSFTGTPPLVTSGLYLDDRLRTSVGLVALTLQAGVRLDALHDGASWLSATRDHMLEPRLNAQIQPLPWLRLRGGWGRLTKAPPLELLAPAPQYYDVVNVNYFADDPVERLAVLTTHIRDPSNPDLGFTRATKAEAGLELGIGASAIQLVLFRDRMDGGFGYLNTPIVLQRERFQLTDSVLGNGIKPDIIEPPYRVDTIPVLLQQPANTITQTNEGVEVTAFLPEFPVINTRLTVTGQWVRTEQTYDGYYYGNTQQFSDFQIVETNPRTPYWGAATELGERLLLTYRLVHHQPHAGLVLTATIQHNVHDVVDDIAGADTLSFLGYLTRTGDHVAVPPETRGQDQYRDLRRPRSGLLAGERRSPASWMMTLQASKTLPLDGRLNFWAFNLLDERGIPFGELETLPRFYPPVRVGVEVTIPLRAFAVWGW